MPPNEQQNYVAGQNRGLTMYEKKEGEAYFYYWHKSQTCKMFQSEVTIPLCYFHKHSI